jgi:hypothetical protein
MSITNQLSADDLAARCAEETAKFSRSLPSDTQYCFELLRRALAEGAPEALVHVYRIYQSQALRWAYQHRGFAEAQESAEFFAQTALSTFYLALRGERFNGFPDLAHVLAYLKTCVHTSIAQHLRDQRRRPSVPLDGQQGIADGRDIHQAIDASELWAYITGMFPEQRDQILLRSAFVLGMKPRQIVAAYGQLWPSERAVSLDLYRIRRVLRNDGVLQRWMAPRAGDDDQANEAGA